MNKNNLTLKIIILFKKKNNYRITNVKTKNNCKIITSKIFCISILSCINQMPKIYQK